VTAPQRAGDLRRPVDRAGARAALLDRARVARRRRTGRPAEDVVLFADLLRDCGALVPGGAPVRAVRALGVVDLARGADARDALRTTLVGDRRGQRLFDLVFPAFWSAADPDTARTDADAAPAPESRGTTGGVAREGPGPDDAARPGQRRTPRATRGRGPGRSSPVAEIDGREVDALARRLVTALGRIPGRRRRSATSGDVVDLRASLRHNLRSGSEQLVLLRSAPRPRRCRLVVLCDVSSSMAAVTALFLTFAHALGRHARLVELGVFNVELTLIGEEFRRRDRARALRWLHAQEHALDGGTRIGHCLRTFLDRVEDRCTPDTVALVLSDGWDVGEPELLTEQMRRLHRRVGRVLWCDPHAAASGHAPQVRGMRDVLPFVDDHVDLSGPPALRALVDHLERHPHSARRSA
jgi:uncharacterized protein with von Willebrand factor type A (vWA) domain